MKLRRPKLTTRSIRPEDLSIRGEVAYIIARAAAGEGRVVSLRPLVFFSTSSGDAWLLDSEDNLALCLAREGTRLAVTIVETPERYAITWTSTFVLEDGAITFADNASGSRTIFRYPTREIEEALRLARP